MVPIRIGSPLLMICEVNPRERRQELLVRGGECVGLALRDRHHTHDLIAGANGNAQIRLLTVAV